MGRYIRYFPAFSIETWGIPKEFQRDFARVDLAYDTIWRYLEPPFKKELSKEVFHHEGSQCYLFIAKVDFGSTASEPFVSKRDEVRKYWTLQTFDNESNKEDYIRSFLLGPPIVEEINGRTTRRRVVSEIVSGGISR